MSRDFQHLSRSQFVLTYGPGSIIETKNGPRLIPSLKTGLGDLFSEETFQKFEIPDVRLCNYIQKNTDAKSRCRILALPSNAGLGKEQNRKIYSTLYFPNWKICYGRKSKNNHNPILYDAQVCPECKTDDDSGVVRFIVACSDGHLDDVDWHYAVHKHRNCMPKKYEWHTSGSSLANIKIKCPNCGAETSMEEIYKTKFPCTGRTPEKEHIIGGSSVYYSKADRPRNCDKVMRITQRQSTSLRIAETVTLLTIPKFDNNISRILQKSNVITSLKMFFSLQEFLKNLDDENFIDAIKNGLKINNISEESIEIIEKTIRSSGREKFLDLFNQLNRAEPSFLDLIYEEFDSLTSGAGRSTDNFLMDSYMEIEGDFGSSIPTLHVYPIRKIRTVTVQTGYRRMVAFSERTEAKKISTAIRLEQDYWYPGYEGFGEGIFVTFGECRFPIIIDQEAYARWMHHDRSTIEGKTDWAEICTLPVFIWLHTFSHALIKAVAEYTGYSAASIRERIYISRDRKTGGILIYNTSPGEDGGMGGLSSIVIKDTFKQILQKVKEIIRICSNDPLCSDLKKSDNTLNGSACYNCLLISETSCEHKNLWLDRHLVMEKEG